LANSNLGKCSKMKRQSRPIKRFFAWDLVGIYLLVLTIPILPLAIDSPYLLHLCALCGIYFILLSGFNLCAGVTHLMSFGHGALYALGGYTSVLLATKAGWPWIPSFLCGVAAAVIGGGLFAAIAYRVKAFYLGLATLAIGWIFYKILWNWIDLTGGQPGIIVPVAKVAGYELWESRLIFVIAGLALFSLTVCRNIMISRPGRALKSIAANEILASAAGVNVGMYKFMVFLLSSFFAGIAGVLYAYFALFIDPSLSSLHTSFSYVVILMIGGAGTLFGPVLGTIIYVFLPAYLGAFQEYWAFLWGAVLIAILLITHKGLLGIIQGALRKTGIMDPKVGNDKEVSCEVWRGPDYSKNGKGYRLETIKVSKSFGGLKALNSVDLLVKPGQIHCLIGPNGSGKTTLINLLTGFYSPDEGEIRLNNERIDKLSPHNIVQLGIARTFQGAIICEGMTTLDNVRVAQHCTTISGIVRSGFASNYARQEEEKYKQRAYGLLKYIGLETKAFEPAENLGDGERRNLEIARALASNPRVLILDEPLAGLMEQEIRTVM
jgi:ABC-type branched-subunit amino acid transport system ATPase component/ABC-type branched-subunit amino acid transport system permease subunit